MHPITRKTVMVSVISGDILAIFALLGTFGFLYAFMLLLNLQNVGSLATLAFFTVILGIAVYYLAFSGLSMIFIKKLNAHSAKA